MLRACSDPQRPLQALSGLLPCFSSSFLHQQQRSAAKKATQKASARGKGKQQQPVKKQKQKLDSKPFDEKDQLVQKVIAMLVPQQAKAVTRTAQQETELVARAKEYSRQKMQEHAAWHQNMKTKLQLKQAALQALPPELRAAAKVEDLTSFPLTWHYLYDTPPQSYNE